jgi:maltose alpha-D-glucosyltransferase/alpha-amylase
VTRYAFLEAYREAAEKRGLFESWEQMRRLIDLFTLEKAFYELAYEIDHRPDWLGVALAGIRELLAGTGHD